ncbi:MAG: carboxypeptidase M32 [Eubacteriaceae bacterium]|nr:carboxypeptidase M32 [Eubacteriaceae bacterium]MBR5996177.1 carboxypeptidase M32 [Eubacteriaceae bacterium]
MDLETAKKDFRDVVEKLHAFQHAMGIMSYDALTTAPSDSAEGRGKSMGILSRYTYDLTAGEKTQQAVAYLKEHLDELDELTAREVTEFDKRNEYTRSIPADEYVRYRMLLNDADAVWHKAKENSDFASFEPLLQEIFDSNKRFAKYYKPDEDPYDVLLDRYEKGMNKEMLDKFFSGLREKIVPLIKQISEKEQIDSDFVNLAYPIDKQREFSSYLMDVIGIDKTHCIIGETEHPFTTGFNKKDVRITTHYHLNDFTRSMYSVIHEGGHALYELHAGEKYEGTAIAGGSSMSIHESQSRFYENLIGRSREFIGYIFPKLSEIFPEQTAGHTAEDFYRAINKSEPSLIRIYADELTYPLHIMVRYEIEKAVMSGKAEVKDLPELWNEKMKEYLGVDVPDDRNGVLQDSHWSGGSIGYFPSYALGSAYGAQMLYHMKKDFDVTADVAKGDISRVTGWLTERIYQHCRMYDPGDLLKMACGEEFDPHYFTDYLTEKYTDLYDL